MSALVSIGGAISGLDTDSIIAKLVDVEKRTITQYQSQQDTLKTEKTAFQEANTRLLALQTACRDLAFASSFSLRTAVTSRPEIATATAGTGATPGSYTVSVASVARAYQAISQSYADYDTTSLGTGTLTFTTGGRVTTVQVDASNNTLSGIRDAINNANSNVRASIVQDGDASYRLLVSAKDTGTANAVAISSTLAGGTAPAFSTLQEASDAQLTLGSGANAITVTRSTNTVSDLIPGVTLNLLSASPGTAVQVDVAQDNSGIETKVQNLVDQYNNVVDFINQQYQFNATTGESGTLLSDPTLREIQGDLDSVFAGSVAGASGLTSLADLGIAMGADGKLVLDKDGLDARLTADPTAVTRVFALTASSTSAQVQFAAATAKTVIDGSAYAVEITQAARQARVTAGVAMTGTLAQDETLTVKGTAIQLMAGMSLAQVVAAVNARSDATGVKASATGADGTGTGSYLSFTTIGYGAGASVSVVSSLSSAGGGTSGVGSVAATVTSPAGESGQGTGQAGLDVAGTINGEAATGHGQFLTGNADNLRTDGLRLRITATAPGALGTIRLTDGIANAGYRLLGGVTATGTGPIATQEDSLDQQIADLQQQIEDKQTEADSYEQRIREQFNRMEVALAQLQDQSTFLTAQLGSLNSSGSSKK